MKKVRLFIQCCLLFSGVFAVAKPRDSLRELAESQSIQEILVANQKAEQEEVQQGLCQQQLKDKQWPTHCWEWLEQQIVYKNISAAKQQKWQSYLNQFCYYLTQQSDTPKLKASSAKIWQQSRCAKLAKKYGPSFENEKL